MNYIGESHERSLLHVHPQECDKTDTAVSPRRKLNIHRHSTSDVTFSVAIYIGRVATQVAGRRLKANDDYEFRVSKVQS